MKENKKVFRKSGITLISLVITVVVLVILAGITISLTIGEQGIFKRGQEANVKQQIAQYIENIELARGEATLDKMRRPTLDELIEKIKQNNVIPEGRIEKLDEEKAEAITKEGYVIIITGEGAEYDRIEIDKTNPDSPSITVLTGTEGTNGYYKSNVVVKITAGEDRQSGVQKVTYILSGATTEEETTITSGDTITISNEGTTTITAYTYDKADNKSVAQTLDVKKDTTVPEDASIRFSGETTQTSLPVSLTATVTHSDETSGIAVTSSKYILNTSDQNLGTDESSYTGGTFSSNGQNITIEPDSATEWYLHVLTIDAAGNAKETIKGPITITANYHTHSASCNTKCSGPSRGWYWDYGVNMSKFTCDKCGGTGYVSGDDDDGGMVWYCVANSTITGCGKNTTTIDRYTIIY